MSLRQERKPCVYTFCCRVTRACCQRTVQALLPHTTQISVGLCCHPKPDFYYSYFCSFCDAVYSLVFVSYFLLCSEMLRRAESCCPSSACWPRVSLTSWWPGSSRASSTAESSAKMGSQGWSLKLVLLHSSSPTVAGPVYFPLYSATFVTEMCF